MGIPSFFRWISKKYPKTVTPVVEETGEYGVFRSKENPNGMEFDNLYVDMNGIIHNCSHPENRTPPESEEGIFKEITRYFERVVAAVRPQNLVYIGIDGVAPRAKMNQQRSRRFRSREEEGAGGGWFDPNCITPGTDFMLRLADYLHIYLEKAVHENLLFSGVKVILSDGSIPGEGEHKIMDFIRNQRARDDYSPGQRHVLHGLDADLIMLGLTTHEPRFHILREDVFLETKRKFHRCEKCEKTGHYKDECGKKREEKDLPLQLFHVGVLRECLEVELQELQIPGRVDFERVIDDWVFLCFLVGNDFLPHIPSLEIREGAIDRLVEIYKQTARSYITKDGVVRLNRLWDMLRGLEKVEAGIFQARREKEDQYKEFEKRKRAAGEMSSTEAIEEDNVQLHLPGFRERYYAEKFGTTSPEFRKKVVRDYLEGLCWVFGYYYRGCQSWSWFYPHHYSPLVSDIFEYGRNWKPRYAPDAPFKPLEQLMAVFPPASRSLVPAPLQKLFVEEEFGVTDFYPEKYPIDMNGKQVKWLAVVILPFIEEGRLLDAVEKVRPELSEEDLKRNLEGKTKFYTKDEKSMSQFSGDLSPTEKSSVFDYVPEPKEPVFSLLPDAVFDPVVLTDRDRDKIERQTKADLPGQSRRHWPRREDAGRERKRSRSDAPVDHRGGKEH
ncbi:MAG: 5'-3' exoribonuclease [Amphiamblys sp. WSBS2006]|nr:MAG: 5'-3' exoribonuclease [Amphiamblys sp. WSBS2006]